MDNSSLNATEIAVGSLLAGNRGGYGGSGGGAWGGGGHGVAPFAGPASNAVRINRNSEITKLGIDRISDQNEETRRNLGENRIMDNVTGGHNRISDNVANSEFRQQDRMRDIERDVVQNAKDAAACCCDVKVQAATDKAELLAAIAAQGQATLGRELDAANARVTQLETINALRDNGHGGH